MCLVSEHLPRAVTSVVALAHAEPPSRVARSTEGPREASMLGRPETQYTADVHHKSFSHREQCANTAPIPQTPLGLAGRGSKTTVAPP